MYKAKLVLFTELMALRHRIHAKIPQYLILNTFFHYKAYLMRH